MLSLKAFHPHILAHGFEIPQYGEAVFLQQCPFHIHSMSSSYFSFQTCLLGAYQKSSFVFSNFTILSISFLFCMTLHWRGQEQKQCSLSLVLFALAHTYNVNHLLKSKYSFAIMLFIYTLSFVSYFVTQAVAI